MHKITCGNEPTAIRINLTKHGIVTVAKVTRFSHLSSVLISMQYERKRPGKRLMHISREVSMLKPK